MYIKECEKSNQQSGSRQYDAIIVLGSGVVMKKEESQPGFFGKMRTIAAAEALRNSTSAPTLVFSGGHTAGPQVPTEAETMSRMLTNRYTQEKGPFQLIPSEKIMTEEASIDTSGNLKNVMHLIQQNGWENIAIVTNDFHCRRVTRLARNIGIKAEILSAEELLKTRDQRFGKVVRELYDSREMRRIQIIETILTCLLFFDRQAKLLQYLTSRRRNYA